VGFGGDEGMVTDDFEISPTTVFSSIFISSLDKLPLRQSKKMLISAAARAENTGLVYNAAKTQLKEVGRSPVLIEGVDAKILFKVKSGNFVVYALDVAGRRIKKISTQKVEGGIQFMLSGKDRALFYEIIKK
jgi:hypothetical protein